MNLRPITIAVAILLLSLTGDTNARPACGNRVLCGATCTYTEIGVPDPHHPLTHHGNDADKDRDGA